ncbi:MAG: TadE/TadG family type IV pilus assembly protein, partial [Pusillimonas sp.]
MPLARHSPVTAQPRHSPGKTNCVRHAHVAGKPSKASRQGGAGLIEFAIVAVPILLLGLGGIEIAQWLLTRQPVSLALLEAGRAGSTGHARPESIAAAFEQALLPLFTASDHASARLRQQAAFRQRSRDTGSAPWQIIIMSPSSAAFNDFADPALAQPPLGQLPAINNHYQFEQDRRRRAQGWPGGLGPESGVSIYQANTLALRLIYLHEPVVPGMKGLIRLLGKPQGSYSQRAMAHGYLPLLREISLVMQSHPVRWPVLEDGTVTRPDAPMAGGPPSVPNQYCSGIWCAMPQPLNGSPGSAPTLPPGTGAAAPAWPAADASP